MKGQSWDSGQILAGQSGLVAAIIEAKTRGRGRSRLQWWAKGGQGRIWTMRDGPKRNSSHKSQWRFDLVGVKQRERNGEGGRDDYDGDWGGLAGRLELQISSSARQVPIMGPNSTSASFLMSEPANAASQLVS